MTGMRYVTVRRMGRPPEYHGALTVGRLAGAGDNGMGWSARWVPIGLCPLVAARAAWVRGGCAGTPPPLPPWGREPGEGRA